MENEQFALSLENISFSYGKTKVVDDFSLDVEKGSFTTLLGSSGSGKTTLLRIIAGFLEPSKGTVRINGEIQNRILPNKRKIGFVFQDYALFPHLTVRQNLLYGLNISSQFKSKLNNEQKMEQVMVTAKSLGIEPLLERFPNELSGGQQQRVALGRSLILEPSVLLMDEPLSSLDTNLRIRLREELKETQQKLGITTVYVTHDQSEALSLSDRIALLNEGKLLSYKTPENLYFEPKTQYEATFLGSTNILEGSLVDEKLVGKKVALRPEWISVHENPADSNATVVSSQFLGSTTKLCLDYKGEIISAEVPTTLGSKFCHYEKGSTVNLSFNRWSLLEK